MNRPIGSSLGHKKHRLSAEDAAPRSRKRVRLDQMLSQLSLDNEPNHENSNSSLHVNPLLESYSFCGTKKRKADVATFISDRMVEMYKESMLRRVALIKYRHPLSIIIVHFQVWVRRLFNIFICKFNKKAAHTRRFKSFETYSKIIALTQDTNISFTFQDLLEIVLSENVLERVRLRSKNDKKLTSEKLQEIRDEEQLARECSYKYWDRVSSLSQDVEMEEYIASESPAEFNMAVDTEMD